MLKRYKQSFLQNKTTKETAKALYAVKEKNGFLMPEALSKLIALPQMQGKQASRIAFTAIACSDKSKDIIRTNRGSMLSFNTYSLLVWILLITFSLKYGQIQGQDTQFSQFNAAPMHIAPSFAGSANASRIVLNYRNQWPQIPGTFVTYSFSYDHYFHEYNSGLGLVLFRDQAGSGNLARTSARLNYSYNFRLTPYWTVRPGLEFSYEQRTIDFFQLIFEDQIRPDGTIGPSNNSFDPIDRVDFFDGATSVLLYTDYFWGGLAVANLMRPNQSMTSNETNRIPMRTSVFAGYRFEFGGGFQDQTPENLAFFMMYKNQGRFNQFDLGISWTKRPVFLGLLYRGVPLFDNTSNGFINNDALVFMGGIRTNDVRIGYSYDFTIGRLVNNTGGAHEISIIYEFNRQINTPRKQRPPLWGN